jgi:hypothetical protein
MAGGDHGDAGGVEVELGVVGGRRQGEADVEHLAAGFDEAEAEGLLDGQAIAAEIVADDDAAVAERLDVGAEAEAQRLDAEQVDVGAEQPAGVVLAKAGRLDQGFGLVGDGVGDEVRARNKGHGSETRVVRRRRSIRVRDG